VYSVVFSPDGCILVLDLKNKIIKIWNTAINNKLYILISYFNLIYLIAFSLDGCILVSDLKNKIIKL
ncbi:hypothetical protein ASPTUDRAFT_129593, partial [Aspergillus tubingensis CBS 134.48]